MAVDCRVHPPACARRLPRLFDSLRPFPLTYKKPLIAEADMSESIQWQPDLETALAVAKESDRPVLLDFYNPG
jgi:hypothetical protein